MTIGLQGIDRLARFARNQQAEQVGTELARLNIVELNWHKITIFLYPEN